MANYSTLVRTNLKPDEWKRVRILAVEKGLPVSQLAGDFIRAGLRASQRRRAR